MTLDWIFSSNMSFGYNVPLRQGRFYVETVFFTSTISRGARWKEKVDRLVFWGRQTFDFTLNRLEEFTFNDKNLQLQKNSKKSYNSKQPKIIPLNHQVTAKFERTIPLAVERWHFKAHSHQAKVTMKAKKIKH